MINYSTSDFDFLLEKTKLSRLKLSLLLQDDFELVLESVAQNTTPNQAKNLSLATNIKLGLYKHSSQYDIKLAEKKEVAEKTSYNLVKITLSKKIILPDFKVPSIDNSYYCLLIKSVFGAKIPPHYIDSGFRREEKRELAIHTPLWEKILKQSMDSGYFDLDIDKKPKKKELVAR